MKYNIEVTSLNSQAKNWVIFSLNRHLTKEFDHDKMIKACEETAQELKMEFVEIEGKLTFKDKQ